MACLDYVYHYLKDNNEATTKQLVKELGYSARSIHGALRKLINVKIVSKRVSLKDARQSIYFLTKDDSNDRTKTR